MKKILLFDIDGTLLRIDRTFIQKFILSIMDDMNIPREALNNVSFAGNTDTAIFRSLLKSGNDIPNGFSHIKKAYISGILEHLKPSSLRIFEGVKSALKSTQDGGYEMGLLTGNFEEIAYHKLKLAGFDHYFSFGAFGCSHHDRNELGPIAKQTYEAQKSHKTIPEDYVIIGDTPRDIACAQAFGCASVAVTTGGYTRNELAEHQPDLILDELSDPQDWIHKLNPNYSRKGVNYLLGI